MITIQKVTSNVQSVPCQSPDIYRHAELCSRRLCSVYHRPHSERILWRPHFLLVFLYCYHQVHRDVLITLYLGEVLLIVPVYTLMKPRCVWTTLLSWWLWEKKLIRSFSLYLRNLRIAHIAAWEEKHMKFSWKFIYCTFQLLVKIGSVDPQRRAEIHVISILCKFRYLYSVYCLCKCVLYCCHRVSTQYVYKVTSCSVASF
jgi:hypothetical protein